MIIQHNPMFGFVASNNKNKLSTGCFQPADSLFYFQVRDIMSTYSGLLRFFILICFITYVPVKEITSRTSINRNG